MQGTPRSQQPKNGAPGGQRTLQGVARILDAQLFFFQILVLVGYTSSTALIDPYTGVHRSVRAEIQFGEI